MLSRRYLRIKTFQAIFAFKLAESDDLELGRKNLLHNLDKLHQLFTYQLSYLVALGEFAEKRIIENKEKQLPTKMDLNPNLRFINNKVTKLLRDNLDLKRAIEKYHISWKDEEPLIRKLYAIIQESKTYNNYLEKEDTFENDRQVWVKIIKNQVANYDLLVSYYEEINSVWVDDINIANHIAMKFIKSFLIEDDETKDLPVLFPKLNKEKVSDDKQFLIDLFDKTLLNSKDNVKLISEKVQNWELERIAKSDMIILEMAITELLKFPTIPLKVTLNEYIELAKMFSTPNSHVFVNGVLDRLIAQLLRDGMIKKEGRGLIDSSTK